MNRGVARIALTLTMALIATGCVGRAYRFANVDLDPAKYEVVGTDQIQTTGLMLFGFIPIQQNSKIERAIRYLIEKHGGDELVNIEVRERWWWGYVINGYLVRVEGTVVKKK